MSLRHRQTSLIIALFITVATVGAPLAFANDDIYREGTTSAKMFHKLGRGATNLLTGFLEIPKAISKEWREYDPFTGFFVGGAEGCAWAVGRTATGAYDMLTFFLPIPADYEPLMEPEFLLPGIWGEPIPELDPVTSLEPLH